MKQQSLGARKTGCELIAALMKGGRTHEELMQATGVSANAAYKWLSDLRGAGIVFRIRGDRAPDKRGRRPVVYHLQSTPFEREDWA